jgi:mono/diheme cytochrome c family protein
MKRRRFVLAASFAILAGSTIFAIAQDRKAATKPSADPEPQQAQQTAKARNGSDSESSLPANPAAASPAASHTSILDARAMRMEGEERFHANCGRCHTAPPKFPPRTMATIVRHMRVRANLTEEDTKFILEYMTQ